jgi:hypothetical protein
LLTMWWRKLPAHCRLGTRQSDSPWVRNCFF